MSDERRVCINCKHCTRALFQHYCFAPQNMKTDLVDGGKRPLLCSAQRGMDSKYQGYCGPSGEWFEYKQPSILARMFAPISKAIC